MNLLHIITVSVSFFIFALLVHFIFCRYTNQNNFLAKGFLFGAIITTMLIIYLNLTDGLNIIAPYILFTLWAFYLSIIVNLTNSVTLKMLKNLYQSPEGSLDKNYLSQAFNEEDGFRNRIAMLEKNKLIIYRNNELIVTKKGVWLMKIITHIKYVFSIE